MKLYNFIVWILPSAGQEIPNISLRQIKQKHRTEFIPPRQSNRSKKPVKY